jgi:hypothetical protein
LSALFDDHVPIAYEALSCWYGNGLGDFDRVLLLPHEKRQLNRKIRSAFENKLNGRKGAVVEGEAARELVRLYSLYAFTDKLIVGSFDEPPGRKLRNLLTGGFATEDELIDDVILEAMDDGTAAQSGNDPRP